MRRAWEIKKENWENIFSLCLKMAWEEAKVEVKVLAGTERQVNYAKDLYADLHDYYTRRAEKTARKGTKLAGEYAFVKACIEKYYADAKQAKNVIDFCLKIRRCDVREASSLLHLQK